MILKQLLFGSFTLLALSFASCSDTAETKETTTEQEETDAMLLHTSPATPGAAGAQSATMVTPPAGTGQAQSVTGASTQAAKTAAGMNPAHGQPGHRCDIEVGAPLDSKPTQPAQMQQSAPSAAPVQIQGAKPATAPAANTTGKVNPAHGQPGHDCTIAVGAPLK